MKTELLDTVRQQASLWLGQPTEGLSPQDLYRKIKDGIDAELAVRRQTHGGGAILTLNSLLALELALRTQVFGVPARPLA